MLIPFDYLFTKYRLHPRGILHLGANTGQEAESYHHLLIKNVVWVEAIPEVHQKLQKHVKPYGHIALQACLSDRDGEVMKFNISSNECQSSSFFEFGTHAQEHPTVKFVKSIELVTARVDTLLAANNIEIEKGWFLNVDLQGAELLALKGMGSLLEKFTEAYVEVNEKHLYKGCPLIGEIDTYLMGFGFVRKEKKMTGNGWGDAFYQRPC